MSVKACVKPRLTFDHSDEDEPLVARRARLNQLRLDFKSSSSLLRPHKEWEKPGSDVQMQKGQTSSSLKENPIQSSKPVVSETQKSSPPSSEHTENGMTSSSSHGCKDSDDGMPLSSSDNEDSKAKVPLDVLNDRSSGVSSDDEPLIFRKTKPRYLRSDLEESPSLVGPDQQSGKLCHDVQTLSYRDSSSLKLEMGHLFRGSVCRKCKLTQLGSVLNNSAPSIDPDNQLGKMGFDVGNLSEQSSSACSDDEPLVLRKLKLKQRSSDLKNSAPLS